VLDSRSLLHILPPDPHSGRRSLVKSDILPEKRPHIAHSRLVPRGAYQVSRLSGDHKATSLLPRLPVTRCIPNLRAHVRGTDLEHGAASLPDVRCQAAPRLATHSYGHYSKYMSRKHLTSRLIIKVQAENSRDARTGLSLLITSLISPRQP